MIVRKIEDKDEDIVYRMMEVFYNSPAVLEQVPGEVLKKNIKNCIYDHRCLKGFVFEKNDVVFGYAMIAWSYSTEFGGDCLWIEDIYIQEPYRNKGYVSIFMKYLEETFKGNVVRFRLEVSNTNQGAIKAYQKNGYQTLSYIQMTKEV
ncbi:GNAT family N-acetyltransferase [Tannockella kyphosi]|uniref:GNAT family N-acetyltransferase n=1 Tax=Tannockella kyphosi TaxID=2899121 RepID=UPI002012B440|nr:GNAT family N-acetyltransferase [Tannockella kyphosi]